MYHHVKKLMYTVRVDEPDPAFGNMLLEQFGGANGELAAAMQYSIQGLNCDDLERKDLLMDIGTEELSHLEIVGALARLHLKPMKFNRDAAEADPLIAIAGGGGVNLYNSHGEPVDGRLPEDHRRARRRSPQQHRRRGARQDRLRATHQFHRRCRDQGCAAVPDDARDHAHEGVHRGARKPRQAAIHASARSRRRPGWSISSSTTRPGVATTSERDARGPWNEGGDWTVRRGAGIPGSPRADSRATASTMDTRSTTTAGDPATAAGTARRRAARPAARRGSASESAAENGQGGAVRRPESCV